jgi:aryl-alcohol dehydrogenase-like predicted oxidoreductase
VTVANKLWWEFWPEQDAAGELDASLERMGLEHLDLACSEKPPEGLTVDEVVAQMGALIENGKLRARGLLNWPAELLAGKYLNKDAKGRLAAERDDPRHATALATAQLISLGAQFEVPSAALAIAFALTHPNVASVLVGATSPEQIEENVKALGVTSLEPRSF